MTEAPERMAIRWEKGAAITSGPLMQHPEYTHYVRADRIEELEAENKNLRYMIIDQIEGAGDDPEIMAASRAEWAARAKAAEAYAEEIYAHVKELEAKLERASKMLPRALLAIYKDRKQEVIDVLETALAELTGGKDE